MVVEDFFDQIYHDVEPLWALEPSMMRARSAGQPCVISIRGGSVIPRICPQQMWMDEWSDLFSNIASKLPDIDLAINELDETRIMTPWETVNEYMNVAKQRERRSAPDNGWISSFPNLAPLNSTPVQDHPWSSGPAYHHLVNAACAPWTPGRNASPPADLSARPDFPEQWPLGSYQGYVQNWTMAKDPCIQAHLFGLHGSLIEPTSIKTSTELLPILGHSKLSMNNDILIPAPVYWGSDEMFFGGEDSVSWARKRNRVIWRGVASGGRNRVDNWRHFHRHRFVSTLNGTAVALATAAQNNSAVPDKSQDVMLSDNFVLPIADRYALPSTSGVELGAWLNSFVDAGFNNLVCFPDVGNIHCPYTDSYFALKEGMPMRKQYHARYLPDVDGNSYSGRWRAFLRSHSVPLKASIYSLFIHLPPGT